jgi:SAM-dependent methyltransferase
MGRNVEDNIDVRIVFEDELPPIPLAVDELDFGYYEMQNGHNWIMLLRSVEGTGDVPVTDYVVETDHKRVHQHKRFSDDVLTTSRSFHHFMAFLSKPINGDLWPAYFAERGYEMLPPHGLSDEDADYIVDSAIKGLGECEKASVLVLGFTPKLLRRLLALPLKSVESLDQFPSKPQEFSGGVTFHTGNWLNAKLGTYDAIVFDEALNNLSRLQLNLFFPQIASLLKPGGHIIGRVMGRFDEEVSERYLERTAWHAVENLREVGGTAHEDVSPLIICLLHSKHLAFSPQLSIVDCGAWNRALQDLRNANRITDTEYRIWRLQFSFKLLSPDLNSLVSEAQQSGFSPVEVRAIQGDYVGRWNDTAEFYRIVNFELIRKTEPIEEPQIKSEGQTFRELPWGFQP